VQRCGGSYIGKLIFQIRLTLHDYDNYMLNFAAKHYVKERVLYYQAIMRIFCRVFNYSYVLLIAQGIVDVSTVYCCLYLCYKQIEEMEKAVGNV